MDKFVTHQGVAIPLRRTNVDTDQIVPSRFLKRITKTGYEDALFAGWRNLPEFILNQPQYRAGSILVAGRDFGTGSSREHAVWALKDYGIRVVISSRFGDIFRGNAGTEGLLAAVVSDDDVSLLWKVLESAPGAELEVDLEAQEIRADGKTVTFEIDEYTRWRLLNGLDPIDMTMDLEEIIADFESRRSTWFPKTLPAKHEAARHIIPSRR